MKRISFIIAMLFSTACFSQITTVPVPVFLDKSEYLIKEFSDENGNTIFRKYQPDGYIDIIITSENHVNGRVFFYEPKKIQGIKIILTTHEEKPTMDDFLTNGDEVVVKLSGTNCQEMIIKAPFIFEVMDNKTFEYKSDYVNSFNLSMAYIVNDKVNIMCSSITKQ